MRVWQKLFEAAKAGEPAALVTLIGAQGSSPQGVGARMIVRPGGYHGTVGGGALEWRLIRLAQDALATAGPAKLIDQALGPDLGQCCGGRVQALIERFGPADRLHLAHLAAAERAGTFTTSGRLGGWPHIGREIDRSPIREPASIAYDPATGELREVWHMPATEVALFGAGHVGRALVLALAPLPFAVTWIDPRPEAFPTHVPQNARILVDDEPPRRLLEMGDATLVVVMTHSHPLDLAIVAAALPDPRFPFVGLIGSATKRARFLRQLDNAGIDASRLVCPIGMPGIGGKEPAVIAASVAAQLLVVRTEIATATVPRESADAA
jgi:xanthine dehydrogenase accessory factor